MDVHLSRFSLIKSNEKQVEKNENYDDEEK